MLSNLHAGRRLLTGKCHKSSLWVAQLCTAACNVVQRSHLLQRQDERGGEGEAETGLSCACGASRQIGRRTGGWDVQWNDVWHCGVEAFTWHNYSAPLASRSDAWRGLSLQGCVGISRHVATTESLNSSLHVRVRCHHITTASHWSHWQVHKPGKPSTSAHRAPARPPETLQPCPWQGHGALKQLQALLPPVVMGHGKRTFSLRAEGELGLYVRRGGGGGGAECFRPGNLLSDSTGSEYYHPSVVRLRPHSLPGPSVLQTGVNRLLCSLGFLHGWSVAFSGLGHQQLPLDPLQPLRGGTHRPWAAGQQESRFYHNSGFSGWW